MRTHFATMNLRDADETQVDVEYTATGGDPGNTYGLPEDCWPAEAPEIGIVRVTRTADDSEVKLTDEEDERISIHLAETHEDDHSDDWGD